MERMNYNANLKFNGIWVTDKNGDETCWDAEQLEVLKFYQANYINGCDDSWTNGTFYLDFGSEIYLKLNNIVYKLLIDKLCKLRIVPCEGGTVMYPLQGNTRDLLDLVLGGEISHFEFRQEEEALYMELKNGANLWFGISDGYIVIIPQL